VIKSVLRDLLTVDTSRSLGAILVLTVASLSNHLKHLVPDIHDLQQLVVRNVEKWAAPDSSFESAILILETIKKKTRFR